MVAVRRSHHSTAVHHRVTGLDDHVGRRLHVAYRGLARETLREKHLERNVVLDPLVKDGYGAVGAQEVGVAPVVVREWVIAHAQRRVPLRVGRVVA